MRPPDDELQRDTDGNYDVSQKLRESIGSQLLSGENRHPIFQLAAGVEFRFATTEFRGDWLWHKEVLALTSGWSSGNLCHHCMAKKADFMQAPYLKQRRDATSFANLCKPGEDGEKSRNECL